MKSFTPLLLLAFTGLTAVSGFNYTISVGKDEVTGLPGVGFAPSRTVVTVAGDLVNFVFLEGAHNVIQGELSSPCASIGGFTTGQVTVPNGTVTGGPTFTYTVTNVSQQLYFYDGAGNNCLQGAVFCINTNETSGSPTTCNAYKAAALALGAQEGVSPSIRTNTPLPTTTTTTTPSPTTQPKTSTGTTSAPATTTTKPGSAGRVGVESWLVAVGLGALGVAGLVL